MRKIIFILLLFSSCVSGPTHPENVPKEKWEIELYSGGSEVSFWITEKEPRLITGNTYKFVTVSGKRVTISGTVVITELK